MDEVKGGTSFIGEGIARVRAVDLPEGFVSLFDADFLKFFFGIIERGCGECGAVFWGITCL